jgi:hypothetical protein
MAFPWQPNCVREHSLKGVQQIHSHLIQARKAAVFVRLWLPVHMIPMQPLIDSHYDVRHGVTDTLILGLASVEGKLHHSQSQA